MNTQDSRIPVLFISHAYYNRGGVETHLRTLCHGLQTKYACYILFPHHDSLVLLLDGQEVQRVSIKPFSILNPNNNHRADAVVVSIVKQIRPRLVHVMHFLGWHLSLFETLHASSVPFIISLHDYYALTPVFTLPEQSVEDTLSKEHALKYFGKDISPELKNRRTFLQAAFGYAKARILPSQFLQSIIEPIFPGEYTLIPYGIEPFECAPRPQSDEVTRIGFLGSLIPQKGWQILVEAFSKIYERNKNISLDVYGGAQEALPTIPGVTFHGSYEQKDLPTILSSFDIAIIPSTFPETYSIVLSELWWAKKAVIASRIGALAERIEDGINGRLFEAGNAEDLARVLEEAIDNNEWQQWQATPPFLAEDMLVAFSQLYTRCIS